jgi:CRP-like cAMP-binding protein
MAKRRIPINVLGQNALLRLLGDHGRKSFKTALEPISLGIRDVLYEANRPIANVYFPIGGVHSLLVVMRDGSTVEATTVGNEGMTGLPVFHRAETSPYRAICQVPGDSLRMRREDFCEELKRNDRLQDVLRRYDQVLMNQMAYSVACNRLHSVEERMCRWLLMTQDRVGQDQIFLTQDFLAQMLGVRRPSVTVVAGVLQKAGLIAYTRGRILVLDRERLEAVSCEC